MTAVKTDKLVDRSPIFYGWIVWAVGTLGFLASSPGQSFTVSLFFDHFIADLGMTRTVVSLLYSVGTLAAAFSLTFIGRWVDRAGSRRAGALIAAGLALALAFMSAVTGPLMLVIGFVLIRGLGQGAITLVSSNVIAQWFRRRRGLVTGIASFIYILAQGVIVQVLTRLIGAVGWRTAWLVQAAVIGGVAVPLFALLARNRPEEFGLRPDGDATAPGEADLPGAAAEVSFTLAEAMRMPIFCVFLLMQALNAGWVTGLIIHQISLFEVVGHGPAVPVQVFSLAATVAAVMTLASGPLINRVRAQWVAALEMLLLIGVLGLAMVMVTRPLTIVYGVVLGALMGIWPVFDGVVWPNVFGREHYGAIRGLVQTAGVAGSSAGPIIFSLAFDAGGAYNAALWIGIAIAGAVLIGSLVVKAPQPQ